MYNTHIYKLIYIYIYIYIIHIYIYIYIYLDQIYIYTYIYLETPGLHMCVCVCVCIYIYVYIYISWDRPECVNKEALHICYFTTSANVLYYLNVLYYQVFLEISLNASIERHATYRFDVYDSGIGISKQLQEKLFQRFVQGDESTTRAYGRLRYSSTRLRYSSTRLRYSSTRLIVSAICVDFACLPSNIYM
jgi:hypothetical protein